MDRTLALLLAVTAGAVVAGQAPTNGALGREIGDLRATLVNFAVGGAIMLLVALVIGGGAGGLAADPVRWHYLGGVMGVVFVSVAIITIAPLGATLQTAAIITGQLSAALVIDRFGLLGLPARPITLLHLAGIALLAGGVVVLARA